jgi:uncharacterized RDD family membrane protein YckC
VAASGGGATLPLASLRRRLAALFYEATLIAALILVLGFVLAPAVSRSPSHDALQIPDVAGRVFMLCTLFMAGAVYCAWTWSNGRRTLPMKTWRIRLVTGAGGNLDARRALVRYAATWIGPTIALSVYALARPGAGSKHALWLVAIGYAGALVDRDGQFLHDRIAGTRLVRERTT